MARTIALAAFVIAQLPGATVAASCAGPTVTAVAVRSMTPTRYLNYYHVTATVTNRGGEGQPADVLQFVDIKQYGDRLDDRGVPPLAAGESYTVSYTWRRAVDAGKWTTPLDFGIRPVAPSPGADCAATASGITF
jgi:hypothetical protein